MTKELKDSGVEWIHTIPSDWGIIKFKYLVQQTNAGEVIDKSFWNSGTELLYTCQKTPMLSDYVGFPKEKRTQLGDILLTRNASPYIFIPREGSIYSNVVQRVKVVDGYDIRYIKYALLLGAEALMVNGNTIPSYNMEVWKNIYIPKIDKKTQTLISDFLDLESRRIDDFIDQTRSSIEDYKKLKQAVITQAVTKGIQKNRGMRNSGVEWIGEIPNNWNIYRIANLYEERNENGQEDLPILTISINTGISDHEVAEDEQIRIFVRSEDRTKYKRVYVGDLSYNMMRAWQGAFGAARVDGMVSPAYVVAKPKEPKAIDSRYIESLLRTPSAIEEMHRYSRGITDFRLRLYWPEFKNIKVCLPPYKEQKEIADFIDIKATEIDRIISQKEKFLSEMELYKKSLIYEYVTGKKEVPV